MGGFQFKFAAKSIEKIVRSLSVRRNSNEVEPKSPGSDSGIGNGYFLNAQASQRSTSSGQDKTGTLSSRPDEAQRYYEMPPRSMTSPALMSRARTVSEKAEEGDEVRAQHTEIDQGPRDSEFLNVPFSIPDHASACDKET